MIKYLQHNEIDKTKWDLCIEQSMNSIVYGYSWYLDAMSPGWEALVQDDYEAVFPLTQGKKIFHYLYQPFFSQQLGLFYKTQLGADQLDKFIKSIPAKFRFIDIQLNESNHPHKVKQEYLIRRKNFLLDLEKPYAKLAKQYNDHTKRNLKKAHKNTLVVVAAGPGPAVDFYIRHRGNETLGIGAKDYARFKSVLEYADRKGLLMCSFVLDEKNRQLACGIFLVHRNRVLYVMGAASKEGRDKRAMYHLFDQVIHKFSEQPFFLDFEGSDIESIARFFKGFGAEKNNYYRLRINRLPWFIRWLK